MGIKFGAPPPRANVAPSPNFTGAGAADAKNRLLANELRNRQIAYAAQLYNKGMGKRSPILDRFDEWFGPEPKDAVADGTLVSPEVLTDDTLVNSEVPVVIPVDEPNTDAVAFPFLDGGGSSSSGLKELMNEEELLQQQMLNPIPEEELVSGLSGNNGFDLVNALRMYT